MTTEPLTSYPAVAGRPGGGVGVGGIVVIRDGASAAEKNILQPWRKQQWCIPKVNGEFVAAMEDVLDLYGEPYDPHRPVVCFDETSTQLLAGTPPSGRTTSTGGRARAICSWPVNPWPVGGRWR
jgi:hypothetical protein